VGFFRSQVCALAHHLEVCASSGSAYRSVMGRTKWPATYTRYFELGMQLSPALQSPFSFHLGCVFARNNKNLWFRNMTN